jgi:UDP-glucose 4-epimerase
MNIIVTGGAGFIGVNLIKQLVKKGHNVTSIDNYHTGKEENHINGATYLNMDIRNITDYNWLKPDIIFNLAAIARIQPSFKQPKEYFTTNANGTLNLVHYCSQNNIPLVYAGSSSKYSGRFKNPYTFSKDIGEDLVTLYQKHYGLKASIVRFYNVYGPHQLEEGGYCTVIGIWLKALRENRKLIVYGDGEQRRDFTHVDDIVNALIKIQDQNAWGHEFELGRGVNFSLNEIVSLLGAEPDYHPARPGEARITLNTDTKAKEILGWKAKTNLEDYLVSYL